MGYACANPKVKKKNRVKLAPGSSECIAVDAVSR